MIIFKKKFKKLEEEINSCIKKGEYLHAGIIAENSGYRKLKRLAEGYYNICERLFREELRKEVHQKILKEKIDISEYSLDKPYIQN